VSTTVVNHLEILGVNLKIQAVSRARLILAARSD
jgi:hypothetical protein